MPGRPVRCHERIGQAGVELVEDRFPQACRHARGHHLDDTAQAVARGHANALVRDGVAEVLFPLAGLTEETNFRRRGTSLYMVKRVAPAPVIAPIRIRPLTVKGMASTL